MEISELDGKAYGMIFSKPAVVYNSVAFTELNAYKVRAVKRPLLAEVEKPCLGLTVGEAADGTFRAPFSAPFACFDFNRRQNTSTMLAVVSELRSRFPGMKITLPPPIYSPVMTAQTVLALCQGGATMIYNDWNYHLDLTVADGYEAMLKSGSRKKLRRALRYNLTLLDVSDDPLRAYSVIERNRRYKGYPLKMNADQILATATFDGPVMGRFFVLTDGATDVCAAIVFDVTEDIAQVIYWGDAPGQPFQYGMNLLAALLYGFYRDRGYRVLDIGPSSEGGIASVGLCDFKESIGCEVSCKPTFML